MQKLPAPPSYADLPPRFLAGARGLDFVNTVEWRGGAGAPEERLTSYRELVIWCVKAGLIDDDVAGRLIAAAARTPATARKALKDALALRDSLAALIEQPAERSRPLIRLDRLLRTVRYAPSLRADGEAGFVHRLLPAGEPLRRPLEAILLEVLALLGSGRLAQLRRCGNPRCGWLYIDASRNHGRRWCSMASCGNQAKARAHYARRRTGAAAKPPRD